MELINLTTAETFELSYKFESSTSKDIESTHVAKSFHDGATLEDVLSVMQRFIVAAGFTYVVGLKATLDDGSTVDGA